MTNAGIAQFLYAMDRAFEGNPDDGRRNWHAFLVNLASVDQKDWEWLPEGGRRPVRQLVEEVGGCKYVYDSQAFGDGSIHWDRPESVPPVDSAGPLDHVLAWLREGHRRLRDHVVALANDAELLRPRLTPQGDRVETRLIVATVIEHDIYHAGEVNHIRALLQGND